MSVAESYPSHSLYDYGAFSSASLADQPLRHSVVEVEPYVFDEDMENGDSDYEELPRKKGKGKGDNEITAVILEKKRKNASAQAAFRARRSKYIASLEATVTSFEEAVQRLQDACRESHDENVELREENVKLRTLVDGFHKREAIWKAYARATAGTAAYQQFMASQNRVTVEYAHSGLNTPPLSSSESVTGGSQHLGEDAHSLSDSSQLYTTNSGLEVDLEDGKTPLRLYSDVAPLEISTGADNGMSFAASSASSPTLLSPVSAYGSTSKHVARSSISSFSELSNSAMYDFSASYGVDINMPPSTAVYPESPYIPASADGFTGLRFQSPNSTGATYPGPHYPTLQSPTTPREIPPVPQPTLEEHAGSGRSRPTRRAAVAAAEAIQSSAADEDGASVDSGFEPSEKAPARSSAPPPNFKSPALTTAATGVSNTLAVIKAQAFGNVRKHRGRAPKRSQVGGEAAALAMKVLESRGLGLGLDIRGGVKRRKRGDYSDVLV